ncbi:hypothetical protein SD70_27225 [Gordoniibacillus kamchatkensis]|uniref:Uncharacterized protein n=1 Tax=Gordoniibacillus kamchatkensis TaxID=1590651 RepID=A0ABR5AB73_9BACL|nr:hypothetical protein [Paenibacillus sp. VKM B-2647]KIL38310.1 hypothetical protein SD70_27225 [Paenibacillus sp. VKM B-2647]
MKIGFAALKGRVAQEYEKKGMSADRAKEVGAAVAAKVGREKYGTAGMARKAKLGMLKKKKED